MSDADAALNQTAQRWYRQAQIYSQPGRPGRLPVSKSTFIKRVQDGSYPPGRWLSVGIRVWSEDDIATIERGLPAAGR